MVAEPCETGDDRPSTVFGALSNTMGLAQIGYWGGKASSKEASIHEEALAHTFRSQTFLQHQISCRFFRRSLEDVFSIPVLCFCSGNLPFVALPAASFRLLILG